MAELDLGRVVGMGIPAGGTDGDVLVKDGATDYAAKWTSTPPQMGSLAYINTGSTADKTYYEGEYLVYNGQLYKVTETSISQGQTLNSGTGGNISAVDGGGFNDVRLKKLTVTGTTTSTGSLGLPAILGNDPSRVVSAHLVGTVGVVLPRGDAYMIVYYYNMSVMADTTVTVEVYYV